jgi:hypothetical protein
MAARSPGCGRHLRRRGKDVPYKVTSFALDPCEGPSWTAVYKSPISCMQVDLKSWSKVKLRLKMENFIKECLIDPDSSTIFTVAVEWILTNSQQCILSCRCHRDPNNFWPKDFCRLFPVFESFGITNGYVRNSQHLQNPADWLLIQGTGIEIKECL